MKSTTIKQLITNFIPPENSTKEYVTQKIQKNKLKNNNSKDIKNPSIKCRRKPRYFNINKNKLFKKKQKSTSTRRSDNSQINAKNNLINNVNNFNNYNSNRPNMNKSIFLDIKNYILISKHERNSSAPDLKYQKDEYNHYMANTNKKKKNNIIKLTQKNINDHIISKDNYVDKVKDFDLLEEFNNKKINNKNYKNSNNDDKLIKVNLTKSIIKDDKENININSYNNIKMNNYYTNLNKNQKRNLLLARSELDISHFKKDIKNIKSIRENIALLKEQLKENREIIDNYKNIKAKNESKLNYTINSNSTIINNKNRHNYNLNITNSGYSISNFHKYNQNMLQNNQEGKNYNNKVNNTFLNNISFASNDITPNNINISTDRNINIQNKKNNNNNLSNSSNKKTPTLSTDITNNGFGKKINLSSVYGGQYDRDDKDCKDMNSLRESDINNLNLTDNNINDDNPISLEKIENKSKNITINTEIDNNIIKNIKNNKDNKDNKNKKYICLKRPAQNKDLICYNKPLNTNSLQNQYNNFKHSKMNPKEKEKEKEKIKQKSQNYSIQYENKNHKYYQFNSKNINNLHAGNTLNNMNKNNNNNNFKFNTINNDECNKFNSFHKNISVKNIGNKTVNNFERLNKKNKNSSKTKLAQNSKIYENNPQTKITDMCIKKRNSCAPYINRDKSKNKSVSDNNESINNSINIVKKFSTKCDFKYKSIYKIGVVCKAGEVVFGETKTNQDNYFNYLLNDNIRFIGVCDGHGEFGHHVSKYLRINLPIEFENELKKFYKDEGRNINLFQKEMSAFSDLNNNFNTENINGNNCKNSLIQKNSETDKNNIFEKVKKIFEKSFSRTDQNLSEFCNNLNSFNTEEEDIFNVEYSGSTCVSILLKESKINKIYIANVGDSRAIIIKETKSKYWTCHQLSRDHKPTEKDEAQRVLDYDGEIEKIEDDDGNWVGPLRVWVKGSDGPGLAMTRTFGDEIGASVGVVSNPEVFEYKITAEDRAIIIASDGLWEYMSNKEVTDVVKKTINKDDPDYIVNELYNESVIRWRLKDQGIDDITIICILLKNS